jgi:acyl carrier protein
MNQTIQDKVRSIAADLFAVPVEEVVPESSPDTIKTWDSIQHLNLMLELEMTFDVKFTHKDIQKMTNIASVVSVVRSRLGSSVQSVE